MASGEERSAATTADEPDMEKVVVTCVVEGLQAPGLFKKTAKGVTVQIDDRGFDMRAVVKDKKGKETTFRKVVKKLPGEVVKDKCTWKVEKDKVVITLVKAKEGSWAVQLSQRGLEQQSDEEEEDN